MPKRIELPSTKHHILVYDEDWEFLESRYGDRGIKPIGISTVLRAIIHQKIQAIRQAEIDLADTNRGQGQVPSQAA